MRTGLRWNRCPRTLTMTAIVAAVISGCNQGGGASAPQQTATVASLEDAVQLQAVVLMADRDIVGRDDPRDYSLVICPLDENVVAKRVFECNTLKERRATLGHLMGSPNMSLQSKPLIMKDAEIIQKVETAIANPALSGRNIVVVYAEQGQLRSKLEAIASKNDRLHVVPRPDSGRVR